MAGQDKLPSIVLSTGIPVQNLGKLSMDDYTQFVKTVDVAISPMMAPHPNYPTLEFASAGAAVVTTKYETKTDLSRYSKNILLADLNIESLAYNIVEAANIDYEKRIENLKSNDIEASWDATLEKVLNQLVKNFK